MLPGQNAPRSSEFISTQGKTMTQEFQTREDAFDTLYAIAWLRNMSTSDAFAFAVILAATVITEQQNGGIYVLRRTSGQEEVVTF